MIELIFFCYKNNTYKTGNILLIPKPNAFIIYILSVTNDEENKFKCFLSLVCKEEEFFKLGILFLKYF